MKTLVSIRNPGTDVAKDVPTAIDSLSPEADQVRLYWQAPQCMVYTTLSWPHCHTCEHDTSTQVEMEI